MFYFGTDGIRGNADWILREQLAKKLGIVLSRIGGKFVVARDVRVHSLAIEKQLCDGLLSANTQIFLTGILPTPALSYIAKKENADFAIMITASHNAPEFNGLKVFGKAGKKLSLDDEIALDKAVADMFLQPSVEQNDSFSNLSVDKIALDSTKISENRFFGGEIASDNFFASVDPNACIVDDESYFYLEHINNPQIKILEGASFAYKRHIVSMFPRFDNIKVHLDCAHGCFAEYAEGIFTALGASVVSDNNTRDGRLVNVGCGSTSIKEFLPMVAKDEIGFSFDGDGDRVLAIVDGKIYDGDAILLALSTLYRLRGTLQKRFVVGTTLTNTRLQRELAWQGTALLRADVGDKYILDLLQSGESLLGGEKSGHIIMLDKAETGDGVLTALTLLETKKTMGSLPKFSPYPMREFNIPTKNPIGFMSDESFKKKVVRATEIVGSKGRIIVRPSGTEPYVRIAVEYFSKNHGEIFTAIEKLFELSKQL